MEFWKRTLNLVPGRPASGSEPASQQLAKPVIGSSFGVRDVTGHLHKAKYPNGTVREGRLDGSDRHFPIGRRFNIPEPPMADAIRTRRLPRAPRKSA